MSRSLVVVALAVSLAGCTDPNLRCQLHTESGACISVLSVVPTVFNGTNTSNVDVVQDICEDGGTVPDEPFTDHNAIITFNNAPPGDMRSTPDLGPAVVFDHYAIHYIIDGSSGPPLSDVKGESTVTVLGGQQVSATFPLVPLATKLEFRNRNGDPNLVPAYAAEYTLTGSDPQSQFTLTAKTNFTMGDFMNCGISVVQ